MSSFAFIGNCNAEIMNFFHVIYDVTKAHSLLCNVGFVTVRLELRKSPHLGNGYYLLSVWSVSLLAQDRQFIWTKMRSARS